MADTKQRARQRALCVASGPVEEQGLDELAELLRTAGVAVAGTLTQRRQHADPNTYLGPGKVAEAREAARQCDANLLACDDELSARQERNLEEASGLPVIDRTAVILDIFATHASSAEGKLQVELAQLEYNLARMRGLWTTPRAPWRRDRHEGPRREPDRDRPPACARPHREAAQTLGAREGLARRHARRARARRSFRGSRSPATRTPGSRRS